MSGMLRTILGTLVTILVVSSANAGFVTYTYIAQNTDDDPISTVTGTFGWETTATDQDPDSDVGEYEPAFVTGEVFLGPQDGQTFDQQDSTMFVDNESFGADEIAFIGPDVRLIFAAPAGSTLTSDALPTSLDLADFPFAELTVFDRAGDVSYTIISLAPVATSVPEPGAFVLLGMACTGMIIYRRRRSSRESSTAGCPSNSCP